MRETFYLGGSFSLAAILIVTLLNFYLLSPYGYLAEVQAASMAFIPAFMLTVVLAFVALQRFYKRLYKTSATPTPIFWLTLLVMVPVLLYLRGFTLSLFPGEALGQIALASGLFAVLSFVVSGVWIGVLRLVFNKVMQSKA